MYKHVASFKLNLHHRLCSNGKYIAFNPTPHDTKTAHAPLQGFPLQLPVMHLVREFLKHHAGMFINMPFDQLQVAIP
jgi:hypothetical protein